MLAAVYSGTPCYRSGGSERHGFATGVHVEQSMELSTKMMNAQTLQGSRRVVLTYPNRPREPQHEDCPRRIGRTPGRVAGPELRRRIRSDSPLRRPSLPGAVGNRCRSARGPRAGAERRGDLFGGVVPQPFVETKAITHPLVRPDAVAPVGWSRDFGTQVKGSVLAGYSAFSLEDARDAGRRLLHEGRCGSNRSARRAARPAAR